MKRKIEQPMYGLDETPPITKASVDEANVVSVSLRHLVRRPLVYVLRLVGRRHSPNVALADCKRRLRTHLLAELKHIENVQNYLSEPSNSPGRNKLFGQRKWIEDFLDELDEILPERRSDRRERSAERRRRSRLERR